MGKIDKNAWTHIANTMNAVSHCESLAMFIADFIVKALTYRIQTSKDSLQDGDDNQWVNSICPWVTFDKAKNIKQH